MTVHEQFRAPGAASAAAEHDAVAGHHASAASLNAVTAEIEQRERLLIGGEPPTARSNVRRRLGPGPANGEEMFSFDERPISGRAAPYGLDLRVIRDGDEAVGHVTLGSATRERCRS